MNRKQELIKIFNRAIEKDGKYVYVLVQVDDSSDGELIINPRANIEKKLQYYVNSYDDNLRLKANNKIQIVACGWTSTLVEIETFLGTRGFGK